MTDGHQAGEIEDDGEDLVEGSLEKLDAEEQIGEIGLDDDQGGADQQQEKAPEEQAVQETGPDFTRVTIFCSRTFRSISTDAAARVDRCG